MRAAAVATAMLLAAVPAFGQAVSDSMHLVLRTGVTCHAQPDMQAAAAQRYHIADTVHGSKSIQGMGRRPWWFDSWRVMGISPSCWVDSRSIVPLDRAHPEIAHATVADSMLAAPTSSFVDLVELITKLEWRGPYGDSSLAQHYPLIRFKRLQLIDRAAEKISRWSAVENPHQMAWLAAHQDLLSYFEPDASWSVAPAAYLKLFNEHPRERWSEDLMWAMAMKRPGVDECYGACVVSLIRSGPAQYWTRYPSGKHVERAIARADSLAAYAVRLGREEAATRAAVDSVRSSLSAVAPERRASLMARLDSLAKLGGPP